MTEQRSSATPKAADRQVATDFAVVCPYCAKGMVAVKGKFDHMAPIAAACDNPACGDPQDRDKGRTAYVQVFADGTFDTFASAPVKRK